MVVKKEVLEYNKRAVILYKEQPICYTVKASSISVEISDPQAVLD